MDTQELHKLIGISEELLEINPLFSEVRENLCGLYVEYLIHIERSLSAQNANEALPQLISLATRALDFARQRETISSFELRCKLAIWKMALQDSAGASRDLKEAQKLISQLSAITPAQHEAIERILAFYPDRSLVNEILCELALVVAEYLWATKAFNYEYEGFTEPISWYLRAFKHPRPYTSKIIEAHYKAATAVLYQGNLQSSLSLIASAQALTARLREQGEGLPASVSILQIRSATITNIGQLVGELETFIKARQLGLQTKTEGVLLAGDLRVVNKNILSYMRPDICVVSDSALTRRLRPLQGPLEYNSFWPKLDDGKIYFHWPAMISIHRRWSEANRGPMFFIKKSQETEGRKALEQLGITRDDWFVTMHVRDMRHGKDGVSVNASPTSNRDADINTYQLAIREITDRGGWVIRLGDRSMKPMENRLPRVIDYPHTVLKSDWMDVFLASASKFFIGTASGLYLLPLNFGVPTVMTNVSPFTSIPLGARDIFVPKLLREKKTGRILTFVECLNPPLAFNYNLDTFKHFGVEIIDNSPEDLRLAVLELLSRVNHDFNLTPDQLSRQNLFKTLMHKTLGEPMGCEISTTFLDRYQELLFSSGPEKIETFGFHQT